MVISKVNPMYYRDVCTGLDHITSNGIKEKVAQGFGFRSSDDGAVAVRIRLMFRPQRHQSRSSLPAILIRLFV